MSISKLIYLHKCSALVNLEIFVSLVKSTSGLPLCVLGSSDRNFFLEESKIALHCVFMHKLALTTARSPTIYLSLC